MLVDAMPPSFLWLSTDLVAVFDKTLVLKMTLSVWCLSNRSEISVAYDLFTSLFPHTGDWVVIFFNVEVQKSLRGKVPSALTTAMCVFILVMKLKRGLASKRKWLGVGSQMTSNDLCPVGLLNSHAICFCGRQRSRPLKILRIWERFIWI